MVNRTGKRCSQSREDSAMTCGRNLLPSRPGTYCLLLSLPFTRRIRVGRRGSYRFPAGYYLYVGSACGPGGLRGRISHHLCPLARPHWHIDYLRQAALLEEVWFAIGKSQEHAWATLLQGMTGTDIPMPRFGSSDCRCASHLFHLSLQRRPGRIRRCLPGEVRTYLPLPGERIAGCDA
ncbi:MAG: GIY-YIG nuclease family protein [Nitrospinota bacterium]|nr:MAG: GIY-YIG nuclease family protein [Nitrospinota bacterium]